MILADLGADVLCVERPRAPREVAYETFDSDTHVRWFYYQRNKRSITLNLKSAEGMDAFRRIVRTVDVVVESFRPGAAARLGVDYSAVEKVNPRVVYCSVSGFGQTGPYRELIAHEPNYQGLSGALGTNRIHGQEPHILSAILGDTGGGSSHALFAILAALYHRERTGEGQYIDVAITAGVLPYLGLFPYIGWYGDAYRNVLNPTNRRPDFRAYLTKDSKYVAISPGEPWLWEKFCRVIGRPDLISQYRPTTDPERDALIDALSAVFSRRTQADWVALNEKENVSITAVYTSIEEVEADPQMVDREMVVELEYEPLGRVKQVGIPYRMSRTPASIRWMPRYGEHTVDVLKEVGFSETDIGSMRAAGVCE